MFELIKLLSLYKTNTMYIGFTKSAGTIKEYPIFYWLFKTVSIIQCLVLFWNNVPNLRSKIRDTLRSIINGSYKGCFKMINISQVIAIIYSWCRNITKKFLETFHFLLWTFQLQAFEYFYGVWRPYHPLLKAFCKMTVCHCK